MKTILFPSLLLAVSNGLVAASDRPNFLLIFTDDHGYGDVSTYHPSDVRTPDIDRLAAEGMLFTTMRANCTVCSPSRAALLTGRYPDRVGVPGVIRTHPENSWGYFDPRVPTLADELKKAGYHTAIVGKWHLGLESPNTPNERGFDFFHGFLGDMMDSDEAIIRGEWKLLQNDPYSPLELYNLKHDPQEKENLAATEGKVFNELAAALRAYIRRGGATPWQKR